MPRDAGDGNSPSADDYDLLVETTLDKPSLLELAAYHEAGHAVAAIALKIKFDYIIVSVFQYTAHRTLTWADSFSTKTDRTVCLTSIRTILSIEKRLRIGR